MEGVASRAALDDSRLECTAANEDSSASMPIALGSASTWKNDVQSVTKEKSGLIATIASVNDKLAGRNQSSIITKEEDEEVWNDQLSDVCRFPWFCP